MRRHKKFRMTDDEFSAWFTNFDDTHNQNARSDMTKEERQAKADAEELQFWQDVLSDEYHKGEYCHADYLDITALISGARKIVNMVIADK